MKTKPYPNQNYHNLLEKIYGIEKSKIIFRELLKFQENFLQNKQKMDIYEIFKNIGGNLERFTILYYLSKNYSTVNEINSLIGKSQPTISRHLKLLEESDIFRAKKSGKFTYYSPYKPTYEKIDFFLKNWVKSVKNWFGDNE